MIYSVEFTATARADLQDILDFIARDNPRRALSFVDELKERLVRKLETFPESGTVIGNCRYVVLDRYIAVYSLDASRKRAVIMLVAEGHRNWRGAFEA